MHAQGYFQTIDCLVLAGYYGETVGGRHWKSNGVSHFLVGLRAPRATQSGGSEKPMFTFSRVRATLFRSRRAGAGTAFTSFEPLRAHSHLRSCDFCAGVRRAPALHRWARGTTARS